MYAVKMSLQDKDVVKIIRSIQKRIFLMIPYVSFLHSQISFYSTTLTNARCKTMPNAIYAATCGAGRDDKCCGKFTEYFCKISC